jgi:lysophospholipase L1-like esterase
MATEDIRRRPKQKFSLLLSPITIPAAPQPQHRRSYIKYVVLLVGAALFLTWIFSESGASKKREGVKNAIIHHKFDKPHVITAVEEDDFDDQDESSIDHEKEGSFHNITSRPFQYIGDIDPTKPQPWPREEKDWWSLHKTLVQRVKASDAMTSRHLNGEYLPQLIFYGDSITEAWNGTSFGNVPGPTRMWGPDEPAKIRQVFYSHFGMESVWGKRALLPPLILGISGSRTYDFIWRIENGEFPTLQLISPQSKDEKNSIKNIERIYIVLMGTNNLGGGMLPDATIAGMDASGRKLLELHQQYFDTPAAILFSELLPRKDDYRAVKMCPPRCANVTTLEPYNSFMLAIKKVNKALPTVVKGWIEDYPNSKIVLLSSQNNEKKTNSAVKTIQCGQDMFAFDNDDEFDAHMPDRLHPNAQGYDVWARCLKRGLEEVMDHTVDLM